MIKARKRKENTDRAYKTRMVEISTDAIEQAISSNISDFLLIPEGYSSENVRVDFQERRSYCGLYHCFAVTFSRPETDEEYAERIEKIKREEEKNRAAHEKRRKTAEANREKKEMELLKQLKAKYEAP